MIALYNFALRVRHDRGAVTIRTTATDEAAARRIVCQAERCPERSIVSVRRGAPVLPSDLQRVVAGYLECAAWADAPEGSRARFSANARAHAARECAAFVDACGPLFAQAIALPGYSPERFGHDFWLTRRGHGAGFWDREDLDAMAAAEVPFYDRDGAQYRATSQQLGAALTACAYGDGRHISRFSGVELDAYRGWLYFSRGCA